jgi:hypothetical protein
LLRVFWDGALTLRQKSLTTLKNHLHKPSLQRAMPSGKLQSHFASCFLAWRTYFDEKTSYKVKNKNSNGIISYQKSLNHFRIVINVKSNISW